MKRILACLLIAALCLGCGGFAAADLSGGDWTIFVYLCGSDLESGGKGHASDDFQEMIDAPTGASVRYVVETGGSWSWEADVNAEALERFVICDGELTRVQSLPRASMGASVALADFLRWGLREYPAEHTALILWNHGSGSINGVCFDETANDDSLYLREMDAALRSAAPLLQKPFDFIGFDACLMATVETASLLVPYADYMIASQETEPSCGWNFIGIGRYLAEHPAADAAELGSQICEFYYTDCIRVDDERDATLSVVDLSRIAALREAFDRYAEDLYQAVQNQGDFAPVARGIGAADNFGGNNPGEGYTNMIDLGGLIEAGAAVSPNAQAALDALSEAVVYQVRGDNHSRASGLSIYYPLRIEGSMELAIFKDICISAYYLGLVDAIAYGFVNGSAAATSGDSLPSGLHNGAEDNGAEDNGGSDGNTIGSVGGDDSIAPPADNGGDSGDSGADTGSDSTPGGNSIGGFDNAPSGTDGGATGVGDSGSSGGNSIGSLDDTPGGGNAGTTGGSDSGSTPGGNSIGALDNAPNGGSGGTAPVGDAGSAPDGNSIGALDNTPAPVGVGGAEDLPTDSDEEVTTEEEPPESAEEEEQADSNGADIFEGIDSGETGESVGVGDEVPDDEGDGTGGNTVIGMILSDPVSDPYESMLGGSTAIDFAEDPWLDEDGTYGFRLSEEGLSSTASVQAVVYRISDDGADAIGFGYSSDILADWDSGLFRDNFDGYWFGLPDGQTLCVYLVDECEGYDVFTSPVLLNGEPTNLRFIWDYENGSVYVTDVFGGVGSTGAVSRSGRALEAGDILVPLYDAYALSDGEESSYTGEEYVCTGDGELSFELLPDGDYLYRFCINDIYGNYRMTDPVRFTVEDDTVWFSAD